MLIDAIFKYKTVNVSKLPSFGFVLENNVYVYNTLLLDGQFSLIVTIGENKNINTKLLDVATQEEYTLHLVEAADGAFVGSVRKEYEKVLTEICEKCCEKEVFKSDCARRVIEYIRNTFGDEPEYLWAKFPDNAIARRKDNQKWYLAILTVSRRKLGLDSDEPVEILDLRIPPEEIANVVDGKKYFFGYHMNKKHWFTICLDGSVPMTEICEWIDKSYKLAKK